MTHKRVSRLLFSVLLLATAGMARAAGEAGDVSRLDEAPSCEDRTPDVASLPDGGFIAVWLAGLEDRPGSGARILGQFLDGDGRPRGPAFRVDAGSTFPWDPRIATDVEGNFMVIWAQQNTGAIRGRVFSLSGAPLTGDLEIAPPAQYTTGARIVAERDGGFTVLWHSTSLQRRRYTAGGEPLGPAETLFSWPTFLDLAAAAHGDDGIVAVWTMPGPQIRGGIFRPGAPPALFHVHTYSAAAASRFYFETPLLAIASRPDDVFVVTWWDVVGNWPAVSAQTFAGTGQPLGQAIRVDDPAATNFNAPLGLDATVDKELSFVVGWQGSYPLDRDRVTIWIRALGTDGRPRGPAIESVDADDLTYDEDPVYLALAGGSQGGVLLLWQEGRRPIEIITTPTPTCFSKGIYARPVHTDCGRGEGLCLQDGRFRVQVAWTLPGGQTGKGQPVGLTRESGYFWFFGDNNVELAVKILDGRVENGHFWVFYGSLSDVGYTITIDDTVTGASKTYVNPPSTLASRGDITAFPAAPPPPAAAGDEKAVAGPVSSPLTPAVAPGPCADPSAARRPGLCLNGQRFEVEVAWHDPFHGTSGIATGVPLTEDSGYFWFFGEDNLELALKVLDGRSYNGKFWVFYGALTNVEYTVRVRHVASGAERIYHNPPGRFLSRSDIDAFTIAE
jgi:hypothetical protein